MKPRWLILNLKQSHNYPEQIMKNRSSESLFDILILFILKWITDFHMNQATTNDSFQSGSIWWLVSPSIDWLFGPKLNIITNTFKLLKSFRGKAANLPVCRAGTIRCFVAGRHSNTVVALIWDPGCKIRSAIEIRKTMECVSMIMIRVIVKQNSHRLTQRSQNDGNIKDWSTENTKTWVKLCQNT